jgi:hypothetical protein
VSERCQRTYTLNEGGEVFSKQASTFRANRIRRDEETIKVTRYDYFLRASCAAVLIGGTLIAACPTRKIMGVAPMWLN